MGQAAGPDEGSVLRSRVGVNRPQDGSSSSSSSLAGALIPPAQWTFQNRGIPQAVAHRGYRASFPENTMGAFRAAVEVGAHAIETDVHLSKDNVVVIAHDNDLKRCYGQDRLIRECDWAFLSTLKTLREPRQPMPRLADLLAYLAEPAQAAVWLLLDIKVDDAAELMVPRLAAALHATTTPWHRRVVLGCWTARHLRLCRAHLPAFATAWIGITLPLARQYLAVPHVALALRQEPLWGRGGPAFVRDVRCDGRPLYAWTVNSAGWMRWAVGARLDAVITDDPRLFLEVCGQQHRGGGGDGRRTGYGAAVVAAVQGWLWALMIPLLVRLATNRLGYYERVGGPEETREVLQELQEAL